METSDSTTSRVSSGHQTIDSSHTVEQLQQLLTMRKTIKCLNIHTKTLTTEILAKDVENAGDAEDLLYFVNRMEKNYAKTMQIRDTFNMSMFSSIIYNAINPNPSDVHHTSLKKELFDLLSNSSTSHLLLSTLSKEYSEKRNQVYEKKLELKRQLNKYKTLLREQKQEMEGFTEEQRDQMVAEFRTTTLRLAKINAMRQLQIAILQAGNVNLLEYKSLSNVLSKRTPITLKNISSL